MHKLILLFLSFLLPLALSAQLTIQVTGIPANTPENEKIYVTGNFNDWNAADARYILTPTSPGQYSVTLHPAPGRIEYKFTRGGWPSVEGNASGKYQANHTADYSGQPQTVQVKILGWEDRSAGGGGSAAPNVFVLNQQFYMPQLKRNRRVWVYLPPDYATSNKRYPVLYLHDAQNLFDNQTSSFGEWQVDEALNKLFNQGDYGCIAIGIDNGGAKRLDEYSPWVNAQYGGGEGDEYMDFITKTLKPYVDATYRTMPGRETTGLMGSSMGGLISMYGFADWQHVFSKAGIFSPAFWFAGTGPVDDVRAHPKKGDTRIYFLAGAKEPEYVQTDITKVANALLSAGFTPNDMKFKVSPDGEHSEWFWRREFAAAYQWLYAGAVPQSKNTRSVRFDLAVAPDTTGMFFNLADIKPREKYQLKIVGADGKVLRDVKMRGGDPVPVGDLPKGGYSIWVKRKRADWQIGKVIK